MKVCSICQKDFVGYGNNAEPINDGVCCDDCNDKIVIPARFEGMKEDMLDIIDDEEWSKSRLKWWLGEKKRKRKARMWTYLFLAFAIAYFVARGVLTAFNI